MFRVFGLMVVLCMQPAAVAAQQFCQQIWGGALVAQDGEFLGYITSQYNLDSIFNQYGNYGSEYSLTSILNKYSPYGSAYSTLSAFYDHASEPPLLIINNNAVAIVTTNRLLQGAVNPYALFACKQ
ncbi:hypothetical protein [Octadecabacter ascidiaceicola]|uniref:Uncharacterized protein n=1 Tax=Octadecabacter ascidiaceicola TaxID=1655543 RepID=A0A238KK84_9RHOB|nr:hypothetical protein [Octadecabacter ascidiaceicola]SMX43235.1 hypothetical protein OCA8868_02906 [Octadecabacter ascidiaceicola]